MARMNLRLGIRIYHINGMDLRSRIYRILTSAPNAKLIQQYLVVASIIWGQNHWGQNRWLQ
jgi:hypothetical protein